MKKLLLCSTIFTGILAGQLNAEYLDADSEYQKDLSAQESWSEDMSNMFLQLPNSFACIISNSGPDVNPTTKGWTALIDEVACGLEISDPNKTGVTYSKAKMSSDRASNDSPQEVSAWFNALNGDRYITNTILRQSSDDLAPFGSWYFSFIKAYDGDDYSTELTSDTTDDFGFVDIAAVGSNIEIKTAQQFKGSDEYGEDEGSQRAIVRFKDGDPDNTVFIGENEWSFVSNDGNYQDSGYMAVAGATNKTHYYRVGLKGSAENPAIDTDTAACFSRENKFTTAHDMMLYDPETGDRIDLVSGFDITTDDGDNGYYSRWGLWVEGDDILFSPKNASNASKRRDGTEVNLKWAPGKLERENYLTETLSDGDQFEAWIDVSGFSGQVYLEWDATNSAFGYQSKEDENKVGFISSTDWGIWMWSRSKRTSVIWEGGDEIKIRQARNVIWDDKFTSAASTKFVSRWEWNDLTDPDILPVSYSEFSSNGEDNLTDFDCVDNNGTNCEEKTYHLTGNEPGTGYEANTLYLDTGDGVLSSSDKPVRFDFAINNPQDTVLDYSDNSLSDYNNDGGWPGRGIQLVLASDIGTVTNCDVGNYSGCDSYQWQTGAMPWDQSVTAFDGSGVRIKLDDEIVFQLTYDVSDDRNADITIGSLSTQDVWNPIPGCEIVTDDDSGDPLYQTCSDISVEAANGQKFMLEYDGQRLHGLPGMYVCDAPDCSTGNGYWMNLLNLKDGTKLTSTDDKEYVVLAHAESVQFLATDISECAGTGPDDTLVFTSLDDIGLGDPEEYPVLERASNDYPLPSISWTDQPEASACTVTMGDTSDCTSE